MVLARAIELRLKISNYIYKVSTDNNNSLNGNSVTVEEKQEKVGLEEGNVIDKGDKEKNPKFQSHDVGALSDGAEEDDDEDEEAERLLHIRDALESLERQLSNLQVFSIIPCSLNLEFRVLYQNVSMIKRRFLGVYTI